MKRPARFTAREQFIAHDELSPVERTHLLAQLDGDVPPLSEAERHDWIEGFSTALSHDAFIPFRDNVDRAQASAVRYILQPGGSIADDGVVAAANEYGMAMAFSGLRLFRH
jgi:AICAR transformylase/IMP cyclohydrolase PurH